MHTSARRFRNRRVRLATSARNQHAAPARARTRVPNTRVSNHARARHAGPGTQSARSATRGPGTQSARKALARAFACVLCGCALDDCDCSFCRSGC
eukprot:9305979-Alexandrium_andersonii.AAC.1